MAPYPPKVIQRIARETGVVRHHRKLDPVTFLHTLVFETGSEIQRTLEYLRDPYNRWTPDPILSAGGFYERFCPGLVEFLRPEQAKDNMESREPVHFSNTHFLSAVRRHCRGRSVPGCSEGRQQV